MANKTKQKQTNEALVSNSDEKPNQKTPSKYCVILGFFVHNASWG